MKNSNTCLKVQRLIDLRKQRYLTNEQTEEKDQIESDLVGFEFMYEGNYANIVHVNGGIENAIIYVEENNGDNWEVDLSLQELLFFI